MKTIICSVACCFILNIGFSQFQHSYGTEKSEVGRSLTQLQQTEKGYLVAGYTGQQIFGGLEATLVKTDLDGNQIWARIYGRQNRDYFSSVRQRTGITSANQASYIVAGATNSFGAGGMDALLTGVNVNGAPVFAATYGRNRRDVANCVQNIKDENGKLGHIFVGETRSYPAFPGNNMYVVRTDLNGNLTRATVIGGKGDQRGLWIEQTKDGGYIIVGSNTNNLCGGSVELTNPATDIFVVKLKADLSIEWNRILEFPKELDPSIRHFNVGTCVKINNQGNYVITGHTNSFGLNNSRDAFLLFMSANGNFLGMKTYGTQRVEMGHSLQITRNPFTGQEVYTVVGQHATSTRKALMFQTDIGGNVLWARDYGDDKNEGGFELVRDNFSRGFAFTGYTTSLGAGRTDIYLVETDTNGKSKTLCEKEIDLPVKKHEPCIARSAQQIFVKDYKIIQLPVERFEYKEDRCASAKSLGTQESAIEPTQSVGTKLFPNPTQDILTIQLGEGLTATQVAVYTLEGRLIVQNNNSGKKGLVSLSTKTLTRGTYIVKVQTDTGETQLMKFIKK